MTYSLATLDGLKLIGRNEAIRGQEARSGVGAVGRFSVLTPRGPLIKSVLW